MTARRRRRCPSRHEPGVDEAQIGLAWTQAFLRILLLFVTKRGDRGPTPGTAVLAASAAPGPLGSANCPKSGRLTEGSSCRHSTPRSMAAAALDTPHVLLGCMAPTVRSGSSTLYIYSEYLSIACGDPLATRPYSEIANCESARVRERLGPLRCAQAPQPAPVGPLVGLLPKRGRLVRGVGDWEELPCTQLQCADRKKSEILTILKFEI